MPGHLEHDVDARPARFLRDDCTNIFLCRVQHVVRFHRAGDFGAVLVDFDGKYAGRAHCLGHGNREQADRAAARDGYALGRNFSRQDGVHGVAEWIEDGGIFLRNRRIQLPDVGLGNHNVLGEGAVGVHTNDLHVLADVRLAGAAL